MHCKLLKQQSFTLDLLFLNFFNAAKSSGLMLSGVRPPESPPILSDEEAACEDEDEMKVCKYNDACKHKKLITTTTL